MEYPVFLRLKGKPCVVVGGGRVAARKIRGLLAAEAVVTVISPEVNDVIANWVATKQISHIARDYREGDLSATSTACALCFAATNQRDVNQTVATEAHQCGIWCNQVDHGRHSDFINPAVLDLGPIEMAISTGGQAPGASKALREALAKDLQDGGRRFYEALANAESFIALFSKRSAD